MVGYGGEDLFHVIAGLGPPAENTQDGQAGFIEAHCTSPKLYLKYISI
jgi:hypothetical protein